MNDAAYVPSNGAFRDFVVTQKLNVSLADLGLVAHPIIADVQMHGPRPPEPQNSLLLGVAQVNGCLLVGPVEAAALPETVIGHCAIIEYDGERISVRADFLGMVPIYHARLGSGSVVSNRLQLVSAVMRRSGATVELDEAAVATGMFMENAFCLQVGTARLPLKGTCLLHPGEIISLTSEMMSVVPAPPAPADPLTFEEYRALIRKGAQDVVSNVSAALARGGVVADLTGGRDSRITLAALAALGRIKDVRFSTRPIDESDVAVASGLVHHFGGSYNETPITRYAINSVTQQLARHRSLFFGLYHELRARSSVVGLSDDPGVQLVGSCGELYRSFYQHRFPAFLGEPANEKTLSAMFDTHGTWDLVDEQMKIAIAQRYAQEFAKLSGDTIGEKLDSHYRTFRNRYHFGVGGTRRIRENRLVWHPLSSPALLEAARRLPPEIKNASRVVFDVTRELHEEAAYLPYNKPSQDFTTLGFHIPSRFDGLRLMLSPRPDLVAQAEAAMHARAPERPELPQLDRGAILRDELNEALGVLRKEGYERLFGESLQPRIDNLTRKPAYYFRWWSRVVGAADLLKEVHAGVLLLAAGLLPQGANLFLATLMF